MIVAILLYTVGNFVDGETEGRHQLIPLPTEPQRSASASGINEMFERESDLVQCHLVV